MKQSVIGVKKELHKHQDKMKNNKIKYAIKQNNYVGLLFFALVFASLLYIIKENTKELAIPEPTNKAIEPINIKRIEITEETK